MQTGLRNEIISARTRLPAKEHDTMKFPDIRTHLIFFLFFPAIFWSPEVFPLGIYGVQYNVTEEGTGDDCYPSPLEGQSVDVEGTVTAVFINGGDCDFFLQDSPSPWHGILVRGVDSDIFSPRFWDYVELTGKVTEESGMTVLKDISNYRVTDHGIPCAPLTITANDMDDACCPAGEAYEGVFVMVVDAVVTEPANGDGEWYVSDDGGAHEAEVDDMLFHYEPDDGDEFEAVYGVVTFDDGEYEISPRSLNDLAETSIYPGLSGDALLDELVDDYKPWGVLSYDNARDKLYAYIDNHGNHVTCIYTGYSVYVPYGDPDPRYYTNKADPIINAEHTWPKARSGNPGSGAQRHNDMHYLYPCNGNTNSSRGNLPFDEIPDAITDKWWRGESYITYIPGSKIDEYSEEETNERFEPREDFKGNAARALFYFKTMYGQYADQDFFDLQKDVLLHWNSLDPVDDAEKTRSEEIAPHQHGMENPFVIDPSLCRRAFHTGLGVDSGRETPAYKPSPKIESFGSFPNPFNPETSLSFRLSAETELNLAVYDLAGRRVIELAAGRYDAGVYSVSWDGVNSAGVEVGSGVYIALLSATGETARQKMVLLK